MSEPPRAAATTPNDPQIPRAERDPEQDARTSRLWRQHRDAVRVRDMVARSDSATPELVAMHDKIVVRLRAQLDDSKPAEDLDVGQLKKAKQLEYKLEAAEVVATQEWAAVDTQVDTAKKADGKCKSIPAALKEARGALPAMAHAAGAQAPRPKH